MTGPKIYADMDVFCKHGTCLAPVTFGSFLLVNEALLHSKGSIRRLRKQRELRPQENSRITKNLS